MYLFGSSIICLISIIVAKSSNGNGEEQSFVVDSVEELVCETKVANLRFKCNIEYEHINSKVNTELLKLNQSCDIAFKLRSYNLHMIEKKNDCLNQIASVKEYHAKATKTIADICEKALNELKIKCGPNVIKGFKGPSIPPVKPLIVSKIPKKAEIVPQVQKVPQQTFHSKIIEFPKVPIVSIKKPQFFDANIKKIQAAASVQTSKELPNIQTIINFLFGKHQNKIDREILVSYIHKILDVKRDEQKEVRPVVVPSLSNRYGVKVNKPEVPFFRPKPVIQVKPKIQSNLNLGLRESLLKKQKLPLPDIINEAFKNVILSTQQIHLAKQQSLQDLMTGVKPSVVSRQAISSIIRKLNDLQYRPTSSIKEVLTANILNKPVRPFTRPNRPSFSDHLPVKHKETLRKSGVKSAVNYVFGEYQNKVLKPALMSFVNQVFGASKPKLFDVVSNRMQTGGQKYPQINLKPQIFGKPSLVLQPQRFNKPIYISKPSQTLNVGIIGKPGLPQKVLPVFDSKNMPCIDFIFGESKNNIKIEDLNAFIKEVLGSCPLEPKVNVQSLPGVFKPLPSVFKSLPGGLRPSSGIIQQAPGGFKPFPGIFRQAPGVFRPSSGIIQQSSGGFRPSLGILKPKELLLQTVQIPQLANIMKNVERKENEIDIKTQVLINYLFENIKTKLDKYKSLIPNGKFDILPFINYMLARYEYLCDKHNLLTLINPQIQKNEEYPLKHKVLFTLANMIAEYHIKGKKIIKGSKKVKHNVPPRRQRDEISNTKYVYRVLKHLLQQDPAVLLKNLQERIPLVLQKLQAVGVRFNKEKNKLIFPATNIGVPLAQDITTSKHADLALFFKIYNDLSKPTLGNKQVNILGQTVQGPTIGSPAIAAHPLLAQLQNLKTESKFDASFVFKIIDDLMKPDSPNLASPVAQNVVVPNLASQTVQNVIVPNLASPTANLGFKGPNIGLPVAQSPVVLPGQLPIIAPQPIVTRPPTLHDLFKKLLEKIQEAKDKQSLEDEDDDLLGQTTKSPISKPGVSASVTAKIAASTTVVSTETATTGTQESESTQNPSTNSAGTTGASTVSSNVSGTAKVSTNGAKKAATTAVASTTKASASPAATTAA